MRDLNGQCPSTKKTFKQNVQQWQQTYLPAASQQEVLYALRAYGK